MKIIASVVLFFVTFQLFGQQEIEPVQWMFDINQVGPKDYELIYKAKIDDPWVIYSKDTPEGGPIPTTVNYTSDNITIKDDGVESGDRKEGQDQMFEMQVIKYTSKQDYVFKQKVTVNDISKDVTGYVTYMLCNNEMCLPPRDAEFSFTIKVVNPLQSARDDNN